MKEQFKNDTPINFNVVNEVIKELNLPNVGKASIREIKKIIDLIEKQSGSKFIRMEMGIPGLPPPSIGTEAEIEALRNGVAAIYPDIDGYPELKTEMARFVKNFLNIDVSCNSCIPTVGSMQGSFAAFLTLARLDAKRDTTLFIDPGFPVHKQQHKVLGQKFESFDVYDYRGDKLKEKLESYFKTGKIHSVLYSNPNNPSWICFTEKELKIIGELANQYDVVVCEDLAYFGMDFRVDYSIPGQPPYQPTVANYTDNYILFISSSKAFSYAGQRIGMMIISNKLFAKKSANLLNYYSSDIFGRAMVFGTVYALSSGTAHSAQYALTAMLKAANDGTYNFLKEVNIYAQKAHTMKNLFTSNGFKIVYDKDIDKPIADGFYFTLSYPGLTGEELIEELLYYGISAISLAITGSTRNEGLRACVSLVDPAQFPELELRLNKFQQHHVVFSDSTVSN
ncbi:MAG: aminotransferase class I/II-fold pyridoxal phosphate-dependent enzyme [Omnitrophica WOR_2 bacterium]|jgi:aspartate/methionine/tyrosine aminotransferase